MKTSLLARRLGLFVALYARGAENLVSFVSRFGSDVVVVLLAQADNHQLRAQPLCEMCVARGLVTAACICDQVEPHGGDWNRFWFTLRASTHRAPLISTTPHGATRMAVRATVDTTRSHAGAPVRDGLRLIHAYLHAARCHLRRDRNRRQHHCCKQQSDN